MASKKSKTVETTLFVKSSGADDVDSDVWDDEALIRAYEKSVSKIKRSIAKKLDAPELVADDAEIASSSEDDLEAEETDDGEDDDQKYNLRKRNSVDDWHVGDSCMAIYGEDDLLYPAKIESVADDHQTCVVRYLYYMNVEEKRVEDLYEYDEEEEAENEQPLDDAGAEGDEEEEGEQDEEEDNAGANNEKEKTAQQKPTTAANMDDMLKQFDFAKLFASMPVPKVLPSTSMAMPMPPMPPAMLLNTSKYKFNATAQQTSNDKHDDDDDDEVLHSMLMSWYVCGYQTGFHYGLNAQKIANKNANNNNTK